MSAATRRFVAACAGAFAAAGVGVEFALRTLLAAPERAVAEPSPLAR